MAVRTISPAELDQPLLPLAEALRIVHDTIVPLGVVETVGLAHALGRVLTVELRATQDVPPAPTSTMDGWALCAADSGTPLAVADTWSGGGAVRIATGQALPPGTDAVVPWEDANQVGDKLTVPATAIGRSVRPAGEDVVAGQRVLASATPLGPIELGLLGVVGVTRVQVAARPRVALATSGDEVVTSAVLGPGQVYDGDMPMLRALVASAGADVVEEAHLPDTLEATTKWLQHAATKADLVITCGGASVGERDWARSALNDVGKQLFWRIALRPGKPIAFGTLRDTPVFVLPGNPASVLTCTHAFVLPALRLLQGADPSHRIQKATLHTDAVNKGRRTYMCGIRVTSGRATPADARSSGSLSQLVGIDGFAAIPPGGLQRERSSISSSSADGHTPTIRRCQGSCRPVHRYIRRNNRLSRARICDCALRRSLCAGVVILQRHGGR